MEVLWIILVLLIVTVIAFFIVDRLLASRNTPKDKATKEQSADKPVGQPATAPAKPATTTSEMKIYNSNLADDLDQIIKTQQATNQTRLEIGSHINKQSKISKYIDQKNYQSFAFDTENDSPEQFESTAHKSGFTKEDYKRIIALSNIDDKK